jgi:chemotaxis signal transduction protein
MTSPSSVAMTEPQGSGLVLRAGGVRWFIPAGQVIEVLRGAAIVRIPGAPPAVRGVVNHRGRIVTAADPIRALELPGEGSSAAEVVVVQVPGRRFAIVVDGVVELTAEPRTGLATMDLDRIAAAIFP